MVLENILGHADHGRHTYAISNVLVHESASHICTVLFTSCGCGSRKLQRQYLRADAEIEQDFRTRADTLHIISNRVFSVLLDNWHIMAMHVHKT